MNAEVSVIEAESLHYLPAKTMLKLVDQSQRAKKHSALFHLTVRSFADFFRHMEDMDIDLAFSLSDGDINLSFTGDGAKIGQVWKALRAIGYEPNSRPEKGKPTFYTFWQLEGYSRIWMQFSSSVCRRVKVGTQMVAQDIYETQCGELPELGSEDKPVAVVECDSDIPF